MATRWFYSHEDTTHGPLSVEEMKSLAAQGEIAPRDLVWPEGAAESERAPAAAVLEIGAHPTAQPNEASPIQQGGEPIGPSLAVPDWLADIKKAETRGPIPEPEPVHDAPEWLEDLRFWVALEGEVAPSGEMPEGEARQSAAESAIAEAATAKGKRPIKMKKPIPWDPSLGPPPAGLEISELVESWHIPTEPPTSKSSLKPPRPNRRARSARLPNRT